MSNKARIAYGGSVESFNGMTLRRHLEKHYDAKRLRQTGSHIRMLLPSGRTIGVPPDSDKVTSANVRFICRAIGKRYPDFLAEIGYPIANKGRSRFKPEAKPEATVGKKTVIRKLNEVIDEAERIKDEIYAGDRDPEIYKRIHEAGCGALAELGHYRVTNDLVKRQSEAPFIE